MEKVPRGGRGAAEPSALGGRATRVGRPCEWRRRERSPGWVLQKRRLDSILTAPHPPQIARRGLRNFSTTPSADTCPLGCPALGPRSAEYSRAAGPSYGRWWYNIPRGGIQGFSRGNYSFFLQDDT